MSFDVHCDKCGARFTLTDDLYERKVRGRVVNIRCRKCSADITVDGSELASKAPDATDLTPTVPLTGPGLPSVGGLWVVSFGDEDDRELTQAQIRKALEAGEIDLDTLVWNTSQDEWKAISEVPELLAVSKGSAGGFLGTGMAVGDAKGPPPLPDTDDNLLGDDEVGPFQSVGAGTIFVEEEGKKLTATTEVDSPSAEAASSPTSADEAPHSKRKGKKKKKKGAAAADEAREPTAKPAEAEKPTPAAETKSEAEEAKPAAAAPPRQPPAKPERKLPKAPPKLKPDWVPESVSPDSDDDAPPSSRTPALTALTASLMPSKAAAKEEASAPSSSDEIFAIGGGAITNALAPVDLSRIPDEPPPSSTMAVEPEIIDEEPVKSSDRPHKKKKKKSTAPPPREDKAPAKVPPKRPSAPSERASKPVAAARPAEEEKSGSPMLWLALVGVLVVVGGYFMFRSPSESDTEKKPTTEPTTATTAEPPKTEPTAEPTATTQPTATATDTGKPLAPETTKPETTKPETTKPETTKPETTKPETTKPETTKPETTKPETTPTATSDVAMAPPFDAGAAKAALASAAAAASGCRQEGDPVGSATVIVTFAESGRVTTANVAGPPFAGTKTGGCIAARMRSAKVPAFSGGMKTVSKTIVIQ